MKRRELVFLALVFGAFAAGMVRERARTDEPLQTYAAPVPVELAPLESPYGELELAGTVVTASGDPAPDVLISLEEAEFGAGRLAPGPAQPLHWTYTDDDGRFHLARLSAGSFRAVLVTPAAPPTTIPLELPAAEEVRWQLSEPLPPLPVLPELLRTRLGGRVLAPVGLEGTALEGLEVVLRPAESAPLSGAVVRRAVCDGEGRFQFEELALEPYRVEVLPPWARGGSWPVLATLPLDGLEPTESSECSITLQCGEISGELRDAEGRSLEGALVKLWPAEEGTSPKRLWPPTATDASGAFVVRDLPVGRYRLRLRAGAAEHELEADVRAGERTVLALPSLDPRLRAAR